MTNNQKKLNLVLSFVIGALNFNCHLNFVICHYRFIWIVLLASGMIFLSCFSQAAEEALYNPRGKRDPFVPLVTSTMRVSSGLVSVENIDELSVEGILYDPSGSVVVINGTVLKEGEELGAVKVLKISPDGALFSVNGVEAFKPLYDDSNKK